MDLNEEIAKVAYELFEKNGRQHGKDQEHWLEAEKIIKARYAGQEKAETEKKKRASGTRKSPAEKGSAVKKAAVPSEPASPKTAGRARKTAEKPRSK
ncbi:MAG: hypothetical protein A4E57_04035 [Syntrophorhabdaceae bacterium PtaU1.Bin034]|nr:MAG: hypothetical protein A4E57_04035 [Syntrophorhabdaceae bacterium PtaU1.Bin034]